MAEEEIDLTVVEEPKKVYNNLRYFSITEDAYKGIMPSPLKDNYPMYDMDKEGEHILDKEGNPTLKESYTFQEVNEQSPASMWCFPKKLDLGSGEVTMWVGKENQELLWADEDVVAINNLTDCATYSHEEILAYLSKNEIVEEV